MGYFKGQKKAAQGHDHDSHPFPITPLTKLQMQSNQQNEHFIFSIFCIVELSGKAKKGHNLLTRFILYLVAT